MQEKILAKLKEQRGQNLQVSDRELESYAEGLLPFVNNDEDLEKISFSKAFQSSQGNINHLIASEVNKVKKVEKPQEKKEEIKEEKKDVDFSELLKNALAPLQDQISKMQGEKITTTRTQELNELLKDAPKAYKDSVFAGFNKAQFADDDDFNAFKELQKTNYESFQQMAKEQGVVFNTPSPSKKPVDDGRDSMLASASKIVADAKKEK